MPRLCTPHEALAHLHPNDELASAAGGRLRPAHARAAKDAAPEREGEPGVPTTVGEGKTTQVSKILLALDMRSGAQPGSHSDHWQASRRSNPSRGGCLPCCMAKRPHPLMMGEV